MNVQVYKQLGAKKYFYEQQPKDLLGKLITAQSLLSGKEVNNKTFWRINVILKVQWNYEQTFCA